MQLYYVYLVYKILIYNNVCRFTVGQWLINKLLNPEHLFKVSDYLEVVKKPMDLEKIREKIDCMEYDTVKYV